MLKSTKAQMALVLAAGLLAGYAAASGKLNPFPQADAGPRERSAPFGGPADPAPITISGQLGSS